MSQFTKNLLLGSLAIVVLLGLVALATKQEGFLLAPSLALAVIIIGFLAGTGAIRFLTWASEPPGGATVSDGPTWRQALVFLGSGVVLGGSTCFGAATTMGTLLNTSAWWTMPALFLCAVGFLFAVVITLVGLVKLLQRAIHSIRGRS